MSRSFELPFHSRSRAPPAAPLTSSVILAIRSQAHPSTALPAVAVAETDPDTIAPRLRSSVAAPLLTANVAVEPERAPSISPRFFPCSIRLNRQFSGTYTFREIASTYSRGTTSFSHRRMIYGNASTPGRATGISFILMNRWSNPNWQTTCVDLQWRFSHARSNDIQIWARRYESLTYTLKKSFAVFECDTGYGENADGYDCVWKWAGYWYLDTEEEREEVEVDSGEESDDDGSESGLFTLRMMKLE